MKKVKNEDSPTIIRITDPSSLTDIIKILKDLHGTKTFKIGDVVKIVKGGLYMLGQAVEIIHPKQTYIIEDIKKDPIFLGGYKMKLKGHDNWFGTYVFIKVPVENIENTNFLDSISEEM